MKDDKKKPFFPEFIEEEPAEKDNFGSHGRVAEAVAKVIMNSKKNKTIGLLGTWGSGKSTVVRMIEDRVEEKDKSSDVKHHFFTYDAWLHQSDPTRRSFLEKLMKFLECTEGVPTIEGWKRTKQEISGERKTSSEEKISLLTPFGTFVAISFGLFPTGITLANLLLSDDVNKLLKSYIKDPSWLMIIPVLMIALSAFFVIICPLWAAVRLLDVKLSSYLNARWSCTFDVPKKPDSILSIFANRGEQPKQIIVTSSIEYTTIEFQRAFQEIMSGVKSPKREFVFVIDNLDRLPEEHAVNFWSGVRSLFLGTAEEGGIEEKYLPTILLPIDDDAVRRMFPTSGDVSSEDLAQSFMDKTFDTTFHVSRPIYSRWKDYLKQQLRKTFGNYLEKEDIHITSLLYERFLDRQNRTDQAKAMCINPTPREVNKLVNVIASLCLQWDAYLSGKRMSYASICYYAINKKDVDKDVSSALSRIGEDGINNLSKGWQKEVGALHFGCEPKEAIQLLLEDKVRTALQSRNKSDFLDVLNEYRGAEAVCRRAVEYICDDSLPNERFLLNAAYLLDASKGTSLEADSAMLWRWLVHASRKDTFPSSLDDQTSESLEALLRNCPEDLAKDMVVSTCAGLSETKVPDKDSLSFAPRFYGCAEALYNYSIDHDIEWEEVKVPSSNGFYLEVMSCCSDEASEGLIRSFQTDSNGASLTSDLGHNFSKHPKGHYLEQAFKALRIQEREEWQPLLNQIKAYIINAKPAGPHMEAALFCLGDLYHGSGASRSAVAKLLGSLRDEGHSVMTKMQQAIKGGEEKISSQLGVLTLLAEAKHFSVPIGGEWASFLNQKPWFVEECNKRLEEFGYSHCLTELAASLKQAPALAPVVQGIMAQRMDYQEVEPIAVTEFSADLNNYLLCVKDEDKVKLLRFLEQKGDFELELSKREFDQPAVDVLGVMLSFEDEEFVAKAEGYIGKWIQSYPVDSWKAIVSNGAEPYGLFMSLKEKISVKSSGLRKALKDVLVDMVVKADPELVSRWFNLVLLTEDSDKKFLYVALRDEILGKTDLKDLALFVDRENKELLREGELEDKADESVSRVLVPLVIKRDYLRWIADNSSQLKVWVKKASDSPQKVLEKELSELYLKISLEHKDDGAEEKQKELDLLKDIILAFGFTVPVPEPDPEDEGDEDGKEKADAANDDEEDGEQSVA